MYTLLDVSYSSFVDNEITESITKMAWKYDIFCRHMFIKHYAQTPTTESKIEHYPIQLRTC
jgi:hypothetical protein